MSKAKLKATFAVSLFVIVIVFCRLMLSSNQRTRMYFAQTQSSEVHTNFFPGLSNANSSLNGYILVLRYAGQQGGGVKSLVSLQRWVKDANLHMTIVEPFIQDSFLGTYRKSFPELKFSDMFDLENFNRVSQSEGVPGLIPWETYVNCAPVRAVLVRIKRGPRPAPPKVLWDARPGSGDCWNNSEHLYNITVNKRSLCYIRVIDYFANTLSHISSAREILPAGLELTAVNLVFDLWSVTRHVASAHPGAGSPYFSNHLSVSYIKNGSVFLTHKLQDSPKILLDVKNYQQKFLMRFGGPSYVAVMARIEYIVMKQRKATESINFTELQELLDETVNVTTTVMAELGTKGVFVTSDVGLYGSKTLGGIIHPDYFHNHEKTRVEELVRHTVERLYRNRWTFEQWEKSFAQATGGVEERGYIAALQRGIASRASCLIMLGGGSFQELTLKSYVGHTEQHKRCIHFVGRNLTSDVRKLYAVKNV